MATMKTVRALSLSLSLLLAIADSACSVTDFDERNDSGASDWTTPGLLVQHVDGLLAVIREVSLDGLCSIEILSNGGKRKVLASTLQPVRPDKKGTKIRVIAGEHKGSTGEVAGIDGPDRIVKLNDGSDVKILHFSHLATVYTPAA